MKKTIMSIILAIFLLLPASVLAATPQDAVLTATISRYEPLPAEPGNYVTVYIQVTNIGNKEAKDVVVEILPQFPFSIDEKSARKEIGILGSQKDYVEDFKIRVSDDAISGVNQLKVRITPNYAQEVWTEAELDIRIESLGTDIQITSVTTDPEELVPGESGKLRIRVKNEAASLMRDIKLKLNLDDTTTATYPFIPIGTTTEQRINRLDSGDSSEFVYEIRPYPDAASQLYKVPITLTYKDNQDNQFTKTDLVGIVVNSRPEIDVNLDDFRSDGTAIIKVTNKGLTNAKLLTLYLLESDDYTLVSQSNQEYIGELESDDFDTTDFQIALNKEDAMLPVKITYRDANNKIYEETFDLHVHGQKTNGNGNSNTGTIIIILVAVLVVGFIVYKVVKKKKEK